MLTGTPSGRTIPPASSACRIVIPASPALPQTRSEINEIEMLKFLISISLILASPTFTFYAFLLEGGRLTLDTDDLMVGKRTLA
jgi:hypothetical protein